MALGFGNVVELAFVARDEASRKIALLAAETGGLGRAASSAAGAAVPLVGLAGAAVAAAGAIFGLARGFADAVEQLDNLSARLGVAVPNLQALGFALKQQGVSGDVATLSLQFLNRAISQNDPLLARLGITTRDTWQAFVQLVGVLKASPDAAARTEVAMRLLGRGAGESLGPLLALADQLPGLVENLRKAGNISTDAELAAARVVDARLDAAQARIDAIWKRMQGLAVLGIGGLIGDIQERAASARRSPGGAEWVEHQSTGRRHEPHQPAHGEAAKQTGAAIKKTAHAVVDLNAALRAGTPDIREYARWLAEIGGTGAGPLERRGGVFPPGDIATRLFGSARGPSAVNQPALQEFIRQSDAMRTVASSAASSIAGSIESIFANFNNKMQTIGSAAKSFWNSLISDILAAIGRLLTRRALGPFFQAINIAIGDPVGGVIGDIGDELASRSATRPRGEGGGRGGDTYIVNGLNTRDLVMELRSPGGGLRRAQDRIQLATELG